MTRDFVNKNKRMQRLSLNNLGHKWSHSLLQCGTCSSQPSYIISRFARWLWGLHSHLKALGSFERVVPRATLVGITHMFTAKSPLLTIQIFLFRGFGVGPRSLHCSTKNLQVEFPGESTGVCKLWTRSRISQIWPYTCFFFIAGEVRMAFTFLNDWRGKKNISYVKITCNSNFSVHK